MNWDKIRSRGKPGEVIRITREEYREGVKAGTFMHVYDKREKKPRLIVRDGYYSPEVLKNLVNIE